MIQKLPKMRYNSLRINLSKIYLSVRIESNLNQNYLPLMIQMYRIKVPRNPVIVRIKSQVEIQENTIIVQKNKKKQD